MDTPDRSNWKVLVVSEASSRASRAVVRTEATTDILELTPQPLGDRVTLVRLRASAAQVAIPVTNPLARSIHVGLGTQSPTLAGLLGIFRARRTGPFGFGLVAIVLCLQI